MHKMHRLPMMDQIEENSRSINLPIGQSMKRKHFSDLEVLMLTLPDWSSVPKVAKVAAAVAAARVVRVAKVGAQTLDGIQCHHRLTGSQLVQLIQL